MGQTTEGGGDVSHLETVTTGPFGIYFTNVNKEMGLRAHSHYAQVTLLWRNGAPVGFPAFGETYAVLRHMLNDVTMDVFNDATNEEVARRLFFHMNTLEWPEAVTKWEGSFSLLELQLAVQGVPDALDHPASITTYTVRAQ